MRTCAPTYRFHPGVHQLLRVLAHQLAHPEDGLPLLVAGVGRVGEVLRPLHQRLQLAAQALRRQGVRVLPQALHAGLQGEAFFFLGCKRVRRDSLCTRI